MNKEEKELVLNHLSALIDSSDQMVLHYEILGQEENQRLMQFESSKWEYLYGLVEADIKEKEHA